MLVLLDSDTKELIAKFLDEKIARFTGAVLSKEIRRPLTLVITEAARIPMARFRDGMEVHYTAPIEVFSSAA